MEENMTTDNFPEGNPEVAEAVTGQREDAEDFFESLDKEVNSMHRYLMLIKMTPI